MISRASVRAVLVMLPVLGLTWFFGLLLLVQPTVEIFQYMFVILNGLQVGLQNEVPHLRTLKVLAHLNTLYLVNCYIRDAADKKGRGGVGWVGWGIRGFKAQLAQDQKVAQSKFEVPGKYGMKTDVFSF